MEGARILLVDDEVEFISALAERLELRDFAVETVKEIDIFKCSEGSYGYVFYVLQHA